MKSDSADDIFDAHFHVIDPAFPLVANQGFLPSAFTVEHYRTRVNELLVTGGAVVSGSFQAFDQSYLVSALSALGDGFVGVANLRDNATDAEIRKLDADGVRAVRFNLFRGGSVSMADLEALANRVHALVNWHVELYLDATDLPELAATIRRLPVVSIDHLGLRGSGFDDLLRLVADGVWVKATGFGRIDLDVTESLPRLAAVRPDRIVFGTDLPSTRAERPFRDSDIQLIRDVLDESTATAVLSTNARTLYRLP